MSEDPHVPQATVQPVRGREPVSASTESPPSATYAYVPPQYQSQAASGAEPRTYVGPEQSAKLRRIGPLLAIAVAAIALVVRLRDPLSNVIIGAEDPYIAMARTWDILSGGGQGAPGPGLLLVPFALMGPDMLYTATRFLPAVIGAAAVLATYFLARRYVTEAGALASGILIAMMPDLAFRTSLMVPVVLDFVLLPLFLLAVMKAVEGSRRATITAFVLAFVQGLVHPWALALALPPVGIFALVEMRRERHKRAVTSPVLVGAGKVFGVGGLVAGLALTPVVALRMAPDISVFGMLSMAAVLLAVAGAFVAIRRRSKFGTLALLWTLLMLPVALIDWFGIWYLPTRAMAYVAIGVALLAAVGVSWLVEFVTANRANVRIPVTFAALGILVLLLAPSAMAEPWYRTYSDEDFDAYDDIAALGTNHVQAASWQGQVGYRAITGEPIQYNPQFFDDDAFRNFELSQHPDTVVLVDQHALEEGMNLDFLEDESEWDLVVDTDDVKAYEHVA